MVCDESTGSLIYGKTYKGNVVDVSTVERLTADLKIIFNEQDYDFKPNLIFVTDRGYDSKDNLHNFLINDYSFVDKIIDRHQFFPRSLLTTILDQGSLQS